LMEKVVLEWNLNYWWENDLSYLHQYYEWHIDIIEWWYRDLLFWKEYENYSSNLQKIFYNSYEITWCSLLWWFLVSFDKKILLSCFDQWINCIIFNEKEHHIIIDKYKNLIVSS
jgi:hypothetical protein